jgi:hypothetical protein
MRDLKSYGLKPEAAELTQMRIHGVTPEYLKGLKDAGYENLPWTRSTSCGIMASTRVSFSKPGTWGTISPPRSWPVCGTTGVDDLTLHGYETPACAI